MPALIVICCSCFHRIFNKAISEKTVHLSVNNVLMAFYGFHSYLFKTAWHSLNNLTYAMMTNLVLLSDRVGVSGMLANNQLGV